MRVADIISALVRTRGVEHFAGFTPSVIEDYVLHDEFDIAVLDPSIADLERTIEIIVARGHHGLLLVSMKFFRPIAADLPAWSGHHIVY